MVAKTETSYLYIYIGIVEIYGLSNILYIVYCNISHVFLRGKILLYALQNEKHVNIKFDLC